MNRRWRPVAWSGAALLVFAVVTALAAPTFTRSPYDPESADPQGSRAVAELLRRQGVDVVRTTDLTQALATGTQQTLVVAYPWLLPKATLEELEVVTADVVLLGPAPSGFRGVSAGTQSPVADRDPQCDLPQAASAGSARTGGVTLVVDSGTATAACYPADGGPSIVQLTEPAGSTTTVVGSAEFLTNEWVDDSGNAALAMNLLGGERTLVWWLPTAGLGGKQSLTSLLPGGVWPVLGALVAIVLLLALWRGRRLGPVVAEPLPVVVLASETTEGRARIYERHRTRELAAQHLRKLTASTVADRLGLPPGAGQEATVTAVTAATGRTPDEVARVLYGPPPERDDDLVTLGGQLAELDQEVRRS
jgi:hypothetical protein